VLDPSVADAGRPAPPRNLDQKIPNLAYIQGQGNEYNQCNPKSATDKARADFNHREKNRHMSKKRSRVSATRRGPTDRETEKQETAETGKHGQAARETVESIVMAIVLAFLFRAFVAEAFVIPTGSMAPTLMGQHKDIVCPMCHFEYRVGASIEIDNQAVPGPRGTVLVPRQGTVVATTCPLCRYRMKLDLTHDADHSTFVGDRILVSKFLYDFSSPKRWDVIVFKFPFNAKENYIKRLVGLPGETLRIFHGDIYVENGRTDGFHMARKPDTKLLAMLQLVSDTRYLPDRLLEIGWPLRWQGWSADVADAAHRWSTPDHGHTYATEGVAGKDLWLRYHHIVPSQDDWSEVEAGRTPPDLADRRGQLITDFYAYNAFTWIESYRLDELAKDPETPLEADYPAARFGRGTLSPEGTLGLDWVGDLALESDVEVKGKQGEVLLQLVRGGVHYICRIDVATGNAALSMDGNGGEFTTDDQQTSSARPAGKTPLSGPGNYSIRFTNVDAELRLWINGKRIKFDEPTTYVLAESVQPSWSPNEPGDLAPVGIGTRGVALRVERLRVLRDVYYVATHGTPAHEYRLAIGPREIESILRDPTRWAATRLFDERAELIEQLDSDQFFPMGDNSPQSSDARLWPEHFFTRDLLIGKALLIYWPHQWPIVDPIRDKPIPLIGIPNVKRMRLIH